MLYLLTLAPTIYNLDSAELTTAAATSGITRATGYPLYLLLGRLWSWLPLGDIGYRMNLFSAVNGVLTLWLLDRILRHWQVQGWAAFGALGLLACAPYFWALSLIAEVYTLHTMLLSALVLSLLHWRAQPTPTRLAFSVWLGAISMGHHAATVLLIPGCAWYVLTTAPRQALTPKALGMMLCAALLGLSVYLYLPWLYSFAPAFNYAGHYDANGVFQPIDLYTVEGLWWLITGRAFAGQMLAYSGNELWGEVLSFGRQLWQAFFAIGIGPGLLGLVLFMRRNWQFGGMLLLMFAANAAFYIDYRVLDKATMFLPNYVIWALWLGVGYQGLLDWIGAAAARRGLQVALCLAVIVALLWNLPLTTQAHDRSARVRGEQILQQLEPNALILGWWDTVPIIEYLQLVEHQRSDIRAINRFLISPADLQQLIKNEIAKRPIYIDSPLSDMPEFEITPLAGVYRLQMKTPDE